MITLFKAIDRNGRTLATVETGDREQACAKLHTLVTDCPDGWYLHEETHTWWWYHRRCQVAATGEYICFHD